MLTRRDALMVGASATIFPTLAAAAAEPGVLPPDRELRVPVKRRFDLRQGERQSGGSAASHHHGAWRSRWCPVPTLPRAAAGGGSGGSEWRALPTVLVRRPGVGRAGILDIPLVRQEPALA